MPGEDKLTHGQRVRLEAFAQAISSGMVVRIEIPTPAGATALRDRPPTMKEVFARAEEIEAWLLRADGPRQRPVETRRHNAENSPGPWSGA